MKKTGNRLTRPRLILLVKSDKKPLKNLVKKSIKIGINW